MHESHLGTWSRVQQHSHHHMLLILGYTRHSLIGTGLGSEGLHYAAYMGYLVVRDVYQHLKAWVAPCELVKERLLAGMAWLDQRL